jgi:hypothetical protein
MGPSIPEDGPAVGFADETPVLVKFPRSKVEERGDRAAWPWLPGTILEQCGPAEWRVVVEVRELATRKDGSKPTPRTPEHKLYYPCCFRDATEIKLRSAR